MRDAKAVFFLCLVHARGTPEEHRHRAGARVTADGGADIVQFGLARQLGEFLFDQVDDLSGILFASGVAQIAFAVVAVAAIGAFFQSDTGSRLLNASQVHREWPFNAILRAADALTPEEAGQFGSEELLVQGTIDCCFMEDGQWILLDYKTDRADDPDAVRKHYQKQLGVYALSLERITGIPVRQRLLCLISAGMVLEV